MKIKTQELTGAALCYAVCMIEMPHLKWGQTIGLHAHSQQIIVPELPEPDCYSPFTGWSMFGPIIEREDLILDKTYDGRHIARFASPVKGDMMRYHLQYGEVKLIAAMRTYVASKMGDEVEVPEELA